MELLVVITIIGILAAMVFPVANGVLRRARKAQAKNDALQVRQAIETYFTEYRKFPVKVTGGGGNVQDMRLETDETLMDVLMGSKKAVDSGMNTRRITFFSGKKATGNPPKAGVVMDGTSGGGELFDPWGEYFQVVLDTSRNDRVADPTTPGVENIPQSVIIWSKGVNTEDEDGEGDDIATW